MIIDEVLEFFVVVFVALFVISWLLTAAQVAILKHRGCRLERVHLTFSILSTAQIGDTYHVTGWFVTFVMVDEQND